MGSVSTQVQAGSSEMSRAQRVAFLVLGVFLLAFVALLADGVPSLVRGWIATGEDVIHRVHDIQHGVFMGIVAAVAVAVQLGRPSPAGAQQVGLVAVTFVVAMIGGGLFGPESAPVFIFLVLVAAYLAVHPDRDRLLAGGEPSAPLALLAVVGGIPLLWYAWGQLATQGAAPATDPHVAEEPHYAGAASATIVLTLLVVAAARRPEGWRMPAWSAGVGAVVLGVGSLLFPAYVSSFGRVWGAAVLVWGLAVIVVTEHQARAAPSSTRQTAVTGGEGARA